MNKTDYKNRIKFHLQGQINPGLLEIGSGKDTFFDDLAEVSRFIKTDKNPYTDSILKFDLLSDKYLDYRGNIMLNAVLHHFNNEELLEIFCVIKSMLSNKGFIFCSFPVKSDRSSSFDPLKHKNYFRFFTKNELIDLLTINDVSIEEIYKSDDGKWWYLFLK